MITFESQEAFEEAVMKIIADRLTVNVQVSGEDSVRVRVALQDAGMTISSDTDRS